MELLSYSAPSMDTPQIIGCVLEAFKAFGLPKAVQHDNGTQFCHTQNPEMPGKLDLMLCYLGVESRHIPPRQPKHNGIIEREIRTTQEEGPKGKEIDSLEGYRGEMANFQDYYNQERCHTASGKPPFFSYKPSPRPLPESFDISQVGYSGPKVVTTRQVSSNGCIRLEGHEYYVSRRYGHRTMSVELSEGIATVVAKGQVVKIVALKPLELKCYTGPCTIARYRGN